MEINLNDNIPEAYAEYAINYIDEHFSEKIRISELAAQIGISRGYLTKLVRDSIGISPHAYLKKVRLEHAAKYIRSTNRLIRNIANECGYEDSLAFSKAFKKKYNESPVEYRKNHKAKP